MSASLLYRWWRPGEYRAHPGDLPATRRMGKTGPKSKPAPNDAPRGKRRRQWR